MAGRCNDLHPVGFVSVLTAILLAPLQAGCTPTGAAQSALVSPILQVAPARTCPSRPVQIEWNLNLPYDDDHCCWLPEQIEAHSSGRECNTSSDCLEYEVCIDSRCHLTSSCTTSIIGFWDGHDFGPCKPVFRVRILVNGSEVRVLEDFTADGVAEGETGSLEIRPESETQVLLTGYYQPAAGARLGDPIHLEEEVTIGITPGQHEQMSFRVACEADFEAGLALPRWQPTVVESEHRVLVIRNPNEFDVLVGVGDAPDGPKLEVSAGDSRDVRLYHGGTWWAHPLRFAFPTPGCPLAPDVEAPTFDLGVVLDCAGDVVCGDGFVDPPEECDPPDNITCDSECRRMAVTFCGNGIIEPGEECDPPDRLSCDPNCRRIRR